MRATMRSFFASEDEAEEAECELVLDGPQITLEYVQDDGERVTWKGAESGEGHFYLSRVDRKGSGTLHRFADTPDHFVGTWVEVDGAYQLDGMWQIEIDRE